MSESAVDGGNNVVEDDCPLCLEPLPPCWDRRRRVINTCCGKVICVACDDKRNSLLSRAIIEGSFGREEEQLGNFCPMCRARLPEGGELDAVALLDRFEAGTLPVLSYHALGTRILNGERGVEADVERGMEIFMLGAQKGDPCCQSMIGNSYHRGRFGMPISVEDAKRWLRAATEQGHAIAECELAIMFKEEGNDAEHLRHLRGSASKGFDEACNTLGRAYFYGEYGLQQSRVEAIRAWTPAAERGHTESMRWLGIAMVSPDPGGPWAPPWDDPSFAKGVHWLRRAAEKGDQESISKLGDVEKLVSIICFRCKKKAPPGKAFLRCSRCRVAWYCSKDCQVQHWKAEDGGHKQFCVKWN